MTSDKDIETFLSKIAFNPDGLVPVIAQRHDTGEVLMMAWMDREAFVATMKTGQMTYWSRSRGKLWRKGETSGHTQSLKEMRVDCDGDTLLAKVEQTGPACHTGAPNCFFTKLS
jgi:phosphoribosyl-AMP cyclohydrolase